MGPNGVGAVTGREEDAGHGARSAAAEARDEMPRVVFTRRRLIGFAVFVVAIVAFLYLVLPKIVGLHDAWDRVSRGNALWLVVAVVLEVISFFGYVGLFRAVLLGDESRIGWRESYQITMSSLAATRVFAAAGAGGIALTAWALRRSGLERRTVASRMIAFLVLLYGVFMATLVIDGFGLALGVIPGPAPFAITVVPGIFGAVVIAIFLGGALLPRDAERVVGRWTTGKGQLGRLARRLAAAPAAAADGVRTALELIRTRDPHLLGGVVWWGFDIATLWACFHAFGAAPHTGVIVMAYFVGMFGNVLPLPAGVGGVDGAMIGAFSAFGVPFGVTVVSVLAYRVFAFWLPTLPGAIAYIQLRRTVQRWQAEPAPAG